MEKISSGKELCDEFFEAVLGDEAVNSSIAGLLHKLHTAGELSKETILEGLKALRGDAEDDQED